MNMLQVNSLPGRGVFKSANYDNITPGTAQNIERPDSITFKKSGLTISPKSFGNKEIELMGEIKEGFLCGTTIRGMEATKPGAMWQKIDENGDTEIRFHATWNYSDSSYRIIDGQKGVKGYHLVPMYDRYGRPGVDEKQVPITCLPGGEYKIDKYLINPLLKTSEFRLKTEEEQVK